MTTATLASPLLLVNDLLTGAEWSPAQTRELLQLTADIKAHPDRYAGTLRGKFLALIFEKPSLRTRVTFEVGIQSMGGSVVFLDHTQARLGERESIADVARNLERWVHGIVARVYEQRVLEQMAANASIPVINALSDKFHPCQALADFFTLEEKFGSLRGFKLAYVGDGSPAVIGDDPLVPSVVYYGNGTPVVGRAAQDCFALGVSRVYLCARPQRSSFYEGLGWIAVERDVGPHHLGVFIRDADPIAGKLSSPP